MAEVTIPLAGKEISDTITEEDYIIVAKSDNTIRKISAKTVKTYVEEDILGGAS